MEWLRLQKVDWVKLLSQPSSWAAALAGALALLHLTILDRSGQPNLMSLSILIWIAIASLLWDKRHELQFQSGIFSTFLGGTLIAIVLLRSISPAGYHLSISPLVAGLGLGLMASGMKGLSAYWKELLILTLLALHNLFASFLQAIDLPLLTAKFGAFSLWLTGFNAYREGVIIALPTGKVEVYGACSGIESIILMIFIACLFLLLFPLKPIQQATCLSLAACLGFAVNGVRVALMAILVAYSNQEAFEYWHGDDGSLIFAIISVALFGLFCWFAYVRNFNVTPPSGES